MANFKNGINAILANNHIYLPQLGAKAKLEILNVNNFILLSIAQQQNAMMLYNTQRLVNIFANPISFLYTINAMPAINIPIAGIGTPVN